MSTSKNILEIAKNTILEEAEAVKNLVNYLDKDFEDVVNLIHNSKGRLIITGIGKSANIGNKIVATLNSTGTPAVFMHAADAIHGDLGIVLKDDVVICISKSGNTPEIKALVPLIKNSNNTLIAMVSNVDSYLAINSNYVLKATIEKEACPNNLAPTSSTTAQLVIGDALAVCLLNLKGFTQKDFAKYHPGGSLGKKLYLKVSDILETKNKPTVKQDDNIKTVIIEISEKRLGATAVISDNNELIGIVTDGDIRRMLENDFDLKLTVAKDIMTKNPKSIGPNEMAFSAFNIMEKNKITQLPVVENNKFIGIIHIHDILNEGIV
jgi:arabinose-5-phosphate isomerase